MENLEVNNNIFRYKDTCYQIKHISSVQVIKKELDNKRVETYHSPRRSVVGLNILGFIFAFLALKFFMDNVGFGAIVFGLISILSFYTAQENKETNKNRSAYYRTYTDIAYGLSLTLLNGNNKIFWSKDKEAIEKIKSAILNSINKEGVSIAMDFSTININS